LLRCLQNSRRAHNSFAAAENDGSRRPLQVVATY
jgi:hypothetical protein